MRVCLAILFFNGVTRGRRLGLLATASHSILSYGSQIIEYHLSRL